VEEPLRAREIFSNQTVLWIAHDLTQYQLGSVTLSTVLLHLALPETMT